ncbi:MAG: trypsin-like peptidase domain-containing protein [Bradymonadaceae bacterium]|nr:trypsin-like peptidase domain-containing protein [Lujinxingiaceae bacterium]
MRYSLVLHLLLLAALGAGACGLDPSSPESPPPLHPDEGLDFDCDPVVDLTALHQPVIYGNINWVSPAEAHEVLPPRQAAAIEAEVAILRANTHTGSHGAPLTQTLLLCDEEPLADEVALSRCSGVLVGPDLMVTARHCLDALPCDQMVVVSDFDEVILPEDSWAFEGRRCTRVLASDAGLDTAVVELEPTANRDISVAKVRVEKITQTTPAILVSHPLGTSTKVDLDVDVRPSARSPELMWFRGDAFQGSSGGGVFDVDGHLVGIVTSGLIDLSYDRDANCMRIVRSESEGFERLASVISVLRQACEFEPEHQACAEILKSLEHEEVQPEPIDDELTEPPVILPEQIEERGCGQ